MAEKKKSEASIEAEKIFEKKGREIIRNGMSLLLERLKYARKYDEKIREAICSIEYESTEKATQVKALIETLRRAALVDTGEVLALVSKVLENKTKANMSDIDEGANEIVVTLDKGVENWVK